MLRSEARPVDWLSLSDSQRDSLSRVLSLMATAVRALPASETQGQPKARQGDAFPVDEDRTSRLALLSGDRGMGKTTVLLSLKRLCEQLGGIPKGVPATVRNELTTLAQRVVWLEPIDMEPLAESSNLLAAILARIEGASMVSGQSSELGGRRDALAFLAPGSGYPETLIDLQRLSADVALAWEGNLAGRAAHLDPDNYAIEVMRAEGARLLLSRRLRKVLNDLSETAFSSRLGGGCVNPLFVLPVDDFDLNPLRCLDLLRLLRMISVPRLFALVLGDLRVAETTFNLKLSGDFIRAAGGTGHPELISLPPEEIRTLTTEMAAHALRKVIPPAQTTWLGPMTAAESLAFCPPGVPEGTPRLYHLLATCRLTATSRYQQEYKMEELRSFFLLEPEIIKQGEAKIHFTSLPELNKLNAKDLRKELESEVRASPYSAKDIFFTSPRHLADLWQDLVLRSSTFAPVSHPDSSSSESPTNLTDEEKYEAVRQTVDVFGYHCRRAIAEDSHLTPWSRQRLLDAVRKNHQGYWQLDTSAWQIDTKAGREYSFLVDHKSVPDKKGEGPKEATQTILVRRSNGWRFLVPQESETRQPIALDSSTTASLMVLHDLLILANLDPREAKVLWQEMLRSRKLRWSRPRTEWRYNGLMTKLDWPAPNWASFREYDFFIDLWHKVIGWFDSRPSTRGSSSMAPGYVPHFKAEDKLERLIYAWIDIHYATLTWQTPTGFNTDLTPRWDDLMENILTFFHRELEQEEKGERHVSDYRVLDWYRELALLLMPETLGLHPHVIAKVDEYFPADPATVHRYTEKTHLKTALGELYNLWKNEASQVRYERARRLAWFHIKGMEDLGDFVREAQGPACLKHLGIRPSPEDVLRQVKEIQQESSSRKQGARTPSLADGERAS